MTVLCVLDNASSKRYSIFIYNQNKHVNQPQIILVDHNSKTHHNNKIKYPKRNWSHISNTKHHKISNRGLVGRALLLKVNFF